MVDYIDRLEASLEGISPINTSTNFKSKDIARKTVSLLLKFEELNEFKFAEWYISHIEDFGEKFIFLWNEIGRVEDLYINTNGNVIWKYRYADFMPCYYNSKEEYVRKEYEDCWGHIMERMKLSQKEEPKMYNNLKIVKDIFTTLDVERYIDYVTKYLKTKLIVKCDDISDRIYVYDISDDITKNNENYSINDDILHDIGFDNECNDCGDHGQCSERDDGYDKCSKCDDCRDCGDECATLSKIENDLFLFKKSLKEFIEKEKIEEYIDID